MIRYLLDTDHISLHERGHSALRARFEALSPDLIAVSVVTVEEALRGRLAVLARRTSGEDRERAYTKPRLNIACGSATSECSTTWWVRRSRSYSSFRKRRLEPSREGQIMTVMKAAETRASIEELIDQARSEPVIFQTESAGSFALLPVDETLLDLLERSPALIAECDRIRERMREGEYWTHEQVMEIFREPGDT